MNWDGGSPAVRTMLTPLNVFNALLSSFTMVLFVVVRCPVKYQSLQERGGHSPFMAAVHTAVDPMTMYYFAYTVLATVAYFHPICSTALLLDIVVKSPTSRDVINAVVYPRRQLAATATLCFFVVYIFAFIIFQVYSDDFAYNDELDDADFPEDCKTLLRCFVVTLMYGMRLSGGQGDVMEHTWRTRLWVDYAYFIIVLVVLLNVVFGIIIDTFSDLRSQKQDRNHKMLHECFVCGLDNMVFDRAAGEPGGFRRHIEQEHKVWDYLAFVIFIWEQDKDEDDGLELFVRNQIDQADISWLPVGKAICLTSLHEEEQSVTEHIVRLKSSFDAALADAQQRLLKAVDRSADGLKKTVDTLASKQLKRGEDLDATLATIADALQRLRRQTTGDRSPTDDAVAVWAPSADTAIGFDPTTAISRSPISRSSQQGHHPKLSPIGSPLLERSASLESSTAEVLELMPPASSSSDADRRDYSRRAAVSAETTTTTLVVEVHCANELTEAHLMGSGDPYVLVRVSLSDGARAARRLGETERAPMTGRTPPTWTSPRNAFILKDPPDAVDDLLFELRHCHKRGAPGNFLGQAKVPWADILHGVTHRPVQLERKQGLSKSYVQGTLTVSARLERTAPQHHTHPQIAQPKAT